MFPRSELLQKPPRLLEVHLNSGRSSMMAAGGDSGSCEERGSRVDECPGLGPLTGLESVQGQGADWLRDMMRVSSGTGGGSVQGRRGLARTGHGSAQGQEAGQFRDRMRVGSGTGR